MYQWNRIFKKEENRPFYYERKENKESQTPFLSSSDMCQFSPSQKREECIVFDVSAKVCAGGGFGAIFINRCAKAMGRR